MSNQKCKKQQSAIASVFDAIGTGILAIALIPITIIEGILS